MPFTPEREVKTARVQCAQLIPEIVTVLTMGEEYTIDMVLRASGKSTRRCHFAPSNTYVRRKSEVDE
jgi:hypothetical protein